MEISYVVAGKRFEVQDESELNEKLKEYNLVYDRNRGDVRRSSDPENMGRYEAIFFDGETSDVVVGKEIASNGYGKPDFPVVSLDYAEMKLSEVKEDIPDAQVLLFSMWA